MQKWIFFVLFIAATALGLGVLIQDISERQAALAEQSGGGQRLNITATNWAFDQAEYTLAKDQPAKVAFINKEGVHELHIKGAGVDIKLSRSAPSQEVTLAPGTYDIECSLPCGEGHAAMKAKLVVS